MITCLFGKPRLFFWTLGYVAQTPSDWLHGSKFLSFPWGLLLKPGHQHLGPTQFDGHGDKHFGLRGLVGTNVCVEFSLLCPLHTSWCALLQGFKASLVSASKRVSKYAETFPLSKLPSGFLCLSFLFYFPFLSTFLFIIFGSLRSSASIQNVFYRNYSTCRGIFYVFVVWKAISTSYSSTILKPAYPPGYILKLKVKLRKFANWFNVKCRKIKREKSRMTP